MTMFKTGRKRNRRNCSRYTVIKIKREDIYNWSCVKYPHVIEEVAHALQEIVCHYNLNNKTQKNVLP